MGWWPQCMNKINQSIYLFIYLSIYLSTYVIYLYIYLIGRYFVRNEVFINRFATDTYLFHNNPCFQCNKAITNFLVFNTCEIRFHDVIGQGTVPMYSYAKILKHG